MAVTATVRPAEAGSALADEERAVDAAAATCYAGHGNVHACVETICIDTWTCASTDGHIDTCGICADNVQTCVQACVLTHV